MFCEWVWLYFPLYCSDFLFFFLVLFLKTFFRIHSTEQNCPALKCTLFNEFWHKCYCVSHILLFPGFNTADNRNKSNGMKRKQISEACFGSFLFRWSRLRRGTLCWLLSSRLTGSSDLARPTSTSIHLK